MVGPVRAVPVRSGRSSGLGLEQVSTHLLPADCRRRRTAERPPWREGTLKPWRWEIRHRYINARWRGASLAALKSGPGPRNETSMTCGRCDDPTRARSLFVARSTIRPLAGLCGGLHPGFKTASTPRITTLRLWFFLSGLSRNSDPCPAMTVAGRQKAILIPM